MNTGTHSRGFTIIELLVVISIIGMLSSIVFASISVAREKGKIGVGQKFATYTYHAFGADATAVWDFDEGTGSVTKDQSGNNNSLNFTPVIDGVDWAGTNKKFSGTDALSFLNAGYAYNAALNGLNLSNGSISFWFNKKNIFTGDQETIFSTAGNHLIIWTSQNNLISMWYSGNGGITYNFNINSQQYVDKWTHITISWNADNIKLYIKGQLQANEITNYVWSPCSPCRVEIGHQVGYAIGSRLLYAYVDEMRIYTQSLQTAEVERLYAESASRRGIVLK